MPRNMRTECQAQDIEPRKVVNDIVHRQCELESIFLLQGAGQMSMLGDYFGDKSGSPVKFVSCKLLGTHLVDS